MDVSQVLALTQGRVANADVLDPEVLQKRTVTSMAALEVSQAGSIAFFFSKSFVAELLQACPSILVTGHDFIPALAQLQPPVWKQAVVVACPDPYLAMAILSGEFGAEKQVASESWVDPSASVDPSAYLGPGVRIGPHVVIEAHVRIGAKTQIRPGSYLGEGCSVGEECLFFPRVVLYPGVQVGNRVRLHSGVVLGADGFGYAPIREAGKVIGHQKIYHVGKVCIEDDVEIGANSAVDRATFGETRIGKNSKIDNLVQVGHNVHLDEGVIICGGAGLAGNVRVGKYAYLLGMCGLANQVHIGDGARVAALTCVSKDVPAGETVAGNPQRFYRDHFRVHAFLNQLFKRRRQ